MSEKESGGKRPPRKRIQTSPQSQDSARPARQRQQDRPAEAGRKPFGRRDDNADRPKSFGRRAESGESARPYRAKPGNDERPRRSFGRTEEEGGRESRYANSNRSGRPASDNQSRFGARAERPGARQGRTERPEGRPYREKRSEENDNTPSFEKRTSFRERRESGSKSTLQPRRSAENDEKPFRTGRRPAEGSDAPASDRRPEAGRSRYQAREDNERPQRRSARGNDEREWKPRRSMAKSRPPQEPPGRLPEKKDFIRLNKYLADAGICSRREADQLIQAGTVMVNGVVVTELGTKVSIHDKVNYGGQTLRREKLRYVLLNKPKGYITTSDDPYDRKTVMELVRAACDERIYPVGRLDRNTLGLLLMTNDGDLAKKMMHPKHGVKKLYHVVLDKPLTKHDMLQIADGLELEDGKAEVDAISYVSADESKKEIGIEIHSGKNRIVRRIFEHLGYKVDKLDRVMLAGLTKLDLPRGKYRHLTSSEVSMLKRIK